MILYTTASLVEFRKPTPKTKELVMGSYFHTAILEPEKLNTYNIIEASSRNTKLYKDNKKKRNK
jgi:hypothetical protein